MKRYLKFIIPSVLSMWVFALYSMVDGFFVSNYVGEVEFSAVNISMPIITIFFATGILFSIGTQAKVGMNLGKGDFNLANKIFSTSIVSLIFIGILFSGVIYILLDKIIYILGASDTTSEFVREYLKAIVPFGMFFMLTYQLEVLVKVDGAPHISALSVIIAAVSNIVLDYLFIVEFQMGIFGAALATGIAQAISSFSFILYFSRKTGRLRFVKNFDFSILKSTLPLGVGDAISEIAIGFTVFLFNVNLFRVYGEVAVIAYTVISYVSVLVTVTMTGVAQGLAPIFSFEYGKRDYKKIRKFVERGVITIILISIIFIFVAHKFAEPIVNIFLGADSGVLHETSIALARYSWAYPFIGLNGLMVTFFASLGRGRLATTLSVLRTPILISIVMFIFRTFMPDYFLWYVLAFAEGLVFPLGVYFVNRFIIKPIKYQV